MLKTTLLKSFLFILLCSGVYVQAQTTVTLTTGSTWAVPANVTQLTVECWGGGAGGAGSTNAGNARAGGGGGAYSKLNMLSVTPGQSIAYQIGIGGSSNTNGGDTWFLNATTAMAKGGTSPGLNGGSGGQGGQSSASVGNVKYNGGNGGNRGGSGNCGGCGAGAGGSGAGSTGAGNNGADGGGSGNTASNGGAAVPDNGGAGGNGTGSGGDGTAGSNYGGGGGGAKKAQAFGSDQNGGAGGQGMIRITYCINAALPSVISGSASVCPEGTYVYSVINNSAVSSYTWTLPSGWLGTSITNSISVTPDSTGGTISVIANSATCGSSQPRTLLVGIATPDSTTITRISCGPFDFNGQTYTQSGTYYQQFSNLGGCDSIVALHLTIASVNASVNQSGTTLVAAESGATYKWARCQGASYTVIAGAVSQQYIATQNGQYALIITKNGCTDTSSCYSVNTVNITENVSANEVKLYPNPASYEINLMINSVKELGQSSIQIIDLAGRVAIRKNIMINQGEQTISINTETLKTGIYMVQIANVESILPSIKLVISK